MCCGIQLPWLSLTPTGVTGLCSSPENQVFAIYPKNYSLLLIQEHGINECQFLLGINSIQYLILKC